MLRVKNVSYAYEGVPVLSNVSFELEAGEIVAIMGPSGCGKTTLLKVISGIIAPLSGRISSRSGQTGYLRQSRHLMPWRTIRENISLGLELQNPLSDLDKEKISFYLKKFNLEEAADLYPDQISGGMLRRAALAQILAIEPDLLLLDEAFTGLDFLTHYDITQSVRDYVRRQNSAAILVTHNFDEALMLADRIIILSAHPATILKTIDVDESASIADLRRAAQESRRHAA